MMKPRPEEALLGLLHEATGIGAGVALVAGLSKGVVSKAVVKATLKLVAKVGTRTLSGAGLALMAAEIAWCMW